MKVSTVLVAASAAPLSMAMSNSSSSVATTLETTSATTTSLSASAARPKPSTTFATKTKKAKPSKTSTVRKLWTPLVQYAEFITIGWPWAGTDMCDNCWARAGVLPQPKYEDEYLKRAIARCKICCPPEKLGTKTCDPSPSPCIATREPRSDEVGEAVFQNTIRPMPWNTSTKSTFPWSLVTPILMSQSASRMSESLRSESLKSLGMSASLEPTTKAKGKNRGKKSTSLETTSAGIITESDVPAQTNPPEI